MNKDDMTEVERAAHWPTPEEIRGARLSADLTQTEAGGLVYTTVRSWQRWESGAKPMHPAFWELFRMKTGGR